MESWIVTGASRGLGRALSLQLAAKGKHVLAIARDAERLATLASQAPAGSVTAFPLDLSNGDTLTPAIQGLMRHHPAIHGLINNAGIGFYRPFSEHSEKDLREIIQVNLTATIQLCHAVLPTMLARGSGHIINVGSDLGRRPLANMAAYVASKHGLTGFTHSLLREVKDAGVRVSLINPGIIDTDFGGNTAGTRDAYAALQPASLAALIMQIIEQPKAQLVDELSVHPVGQASF